MARCGRHGHNQYYQLGTGTGKLENAVEINSVDKIRKIAVGEFHSMALDEEGNLWTWGSNYSGQLGKDTSGSGGYLRFPTKISDNIKYKEISTKREHNLALDEEGNLWSWGDNSKGQLGDNTTIKKTKPLQIESKTRFKQIAAGDYHSMALDEKGNVWVWGDNSKSQLGDGTTTDSLIPKQITKGVIFTKISAGSDFSIALDEQGNIWTWGNVFDEKTSRKIEQSPIQITENIRFKEISAGHSHCMSIDESGCLWAWGLNNWGQLGDETTEKKVIPTKIF